MKIYYYKSLVQNMFLNKIDEVVSHKRVACTIINGLCQQSGGFFVPFFTFFFFLNSSLSYFLMFLKLPSYVLWRKCRMCSQKKCCLCSCWHLYFIFALPLAFLIFSPAAYKCFEFFSSKEIRLLWFFIFRFNFFSVIHDGRTYADVIKFSA